MSSVYVIRSLKNGRYYVGSSMDVEERLRQHNAGMTKSTRAWRPWHLVYKEDHDTLSGARKRESQIKSWRNVSYMEEVLGLSST